jgi:hypothetical protein
MALPPAGLLAIRFSSRKYDCGGQAGGNGVSSRVPPTQCLELLFRCELVEMGLFYFTWSYVLQG